MIHMGIDTNWKKKLIGFGCDGSNVNIANRGLKGRLYETTPWVPFVWYLAHRLDLSLRNALKNTPFTAVDEMLMHVYYLYEKSPKKCCELKCIILELKACLTEEEMSTQGGSRPIQACGTHFIRHNVGALEKMIYLIGAYLFHNTILANDSSVKVTDRHKMKGYVQKWRDSKMLLRCNFFHDLLKPSATFARCYKQMMFVW